MFKLKACQTFFKDNRLFTERMKYFVRVESRLPPQFKRQNSLSFLPKDKLQFKELRGRGWQEKK